MSYDPNVPLLLKREQQWFGSIIGAPVDEESRINPITPSGRSIEVEAAEHIVPSPTLKPAQRIQIYNQQYWWRLLNTLHDACPLLIRLFGYYDFNQTIAIPYLLKYPPNSWSLNYLGDRLPQWIQEEYHASDKELVYDAARMDWAFNDCFTVGNFPPLTTAQLPQEQMEEVLSKPLFAQPYLNLFEMKHHLFNFRHEFLKQPPEYWLENDFPVMEKKQPYFFILYRNIRNELSWKDITAGEYHLLKLFKKGMTVEDACEWLEKQDASIYETAITNLHLWFQEWTQRGWLSLQGAH